jgi:fructose-1,6-bisphosphatase
MTPSVFLTQDLAELAELESIFVSIQTAVKTISRLVNRAPLTGIMGLEGDGGSVNVQGEEQKKLDVITNRVLKKALSYTGERRDPGTADPARLYSFTFLLTHARQSWNSRQ